jgi:hypothetical protein
LARPLRATTRFKVSAARTSRAVSWRSAMRRTRCLAPCGALGRGQVGLKHSRRVSLCAPPLAKRCARFLSPSRGVHSHVYRRSRVSELCGNYEARVAQALEGRSWPLHFVARVGKPSLRRERRLVRPDGRGLRTSFATVKIDKRATLGDQFNDARREPAAPETGRAARPGFPASQSS